MPAIINNNRLEFQADGLGYQAARVQLPNHPADASLMVFYYKGWVEGWPENTNEANISYAWNSDVFFGLSFNGSVSANNGGIVGWTNFDYNSVVGGVDVCTTYSTWKSTLGEVAPFTFYGGINTNFARQFYYGSSNASDNYSAPGIAALSFPSNAVIGTSAVNNFLGVIKMQKSAVNSSNITIGFGTNWEGLSQNNYAVALTSTNTNWIFDDVAVQERTNFRPNWNTPSLSSTVMFPSWVVCKWASGVLGRKLVIDSITIEYYRDEELISVVP